MVKLDFSVMDGAPKAGQGDSHSVGEKTTAAVPETGKTELQRKAEANRKAVAQAAEIGKVYQRNIRTAETRKTEILKGVQAGEDIYLLFMKAVELIGALTDDTVMYQQIEQDLTTVYGYGLLEREPLEDARKRFSDRAGRLEAAGVRETDENARKRILNALEEHRRKIREIDRLIEERNLQT